MTKEELKAKMVLPPITHAPSRSRDRDRDRDRIRLDCRPEAARVLLKHLSDAIECIGIDDPDFDHLYGIFTSTKRQLEKQNAA